MNASGKALARYEVTDDSGFLALVDPDAYEGFVARDWEYAQLLDRFREQIAERRLLIWGTGMENTWRVDVHSPTTGLPGFRSVTGSIHCTQGRLLITSYDSLTMAAQFADVVLPQPHEADQVLTVEAGTYRCRIVQLRDPESPRDGRRESDFRLELERADAVEPAWTDIPWHSP